MSTPRGIYAFLVVIGVVFGSGALADEPPKLRVFFSANRQGEIEPCGCQVNQVGGLDRLLNYLEKNRKPETALFFDSGDTFFSTRTINPHRLEQEKLRAGVIAAAYKKIGVDAATPGEKDLGEGLDYYRKLAADGNFKVVSANLVGADDKPLFARFLILKRGDAKIAVTGVTEPAAVAGVAGMRALEPYEAVKNVVAEMKRESPAAIFVLSQLGLPGDRVLAEKVGDVTAILGARSLDLLMEPERVGKVWITQPQIQGQQIGVADFVIAAPDRVTHELVELGRELDLPANDVTRAIKNYKDKVRDLALQASADAKPADAGNPYVANALQCRNCHTKQYDFWAQTKHASAYLVLFAKNQHFDPECISCHSLGFEQPGGFQKIAQPIVSDAKTAKQKKKLPFVEQVMGKVFAGDKKGELDSRIDPTRHKKLHARYTDEIRKLTDAGKIQKLYIGVQCEHCHGNRNGHPDPNVPTVKKVDMNTCKSCHTPPHAKPFDPKTFPNVACPILSKS